MKNKVKDDTIPNWMMVGAERIHLEVHEVEVDGETFYNPHITIVLDFGENGDDEVKALTFISDSFYPNAKLALYETARSMGKLFENVVAETTHYNQDFEEVTTYDLNEDFEDFDVEFFTETNTPKEKTPKVLH